jgi:hypothetical protein
VHENAYAGIGAPLFRSGDKEIFKSSFILDVSIKRSKEKEKEKRKKKIELASRDESKKNSQAFNSQASIFSLTLSARQILFIPLYCRGLRVLRMYLTALEF